MIGGLILIGLIIWWVCKEAHTQNEIMRKADEVVKENYEKSAIDFEKRYGVTIGKKK